MGAPWEPTRELTIEGAAALIQSSFPSIESRELTFLGSGWEFDAYLTVDGWVFRFPRRAEGAELFERDRQVTELVTGYLPASVSVPRIELVAEPAHGFPYRFAAHRFIPGVPIDDVDDGVLPSLARQIGVALGAMHSIPEDAARGAGVAEETGSAEEQRAWIMQGLDSLQPIRAIDPTVDRAAKWVERTSLPSGGFGGPLRFIHQDLSPEHLLVDPGTGQLNGIIDWTDAQLGDAARDFVFLVAWRGWAFAEEVLRSYPPPVDSGFRDRLRFMSRILTPVWLGLAVQRGTEVEKLTGWVHNAYAPEIHDIRSHGRM
jgi:aminoglycoside phosphotransferase (APT) family kinase protein